MNREDPPPRLYNEYDTIADGPYAGDEQYDQIEDPVDAGYTAIDGQAGYTEIDGETAPPAYLTLVSADDDKYSTGHPDKEIQNADTGRCERQTPANDIENEYLHTNTAADILSNEYIHTVDDLPPTTADYILPLEDSENLDNNTSHKTEEVNRVSALKLEPVDIERFETFSSATVKRTTDNQEERIGNASLNVRRAQNIRCQSLYPSLPAQDYTAEP